MFSRLMSRVSLFLPSYMEDLLAMVAAKEGSPKANFIRQAILNELERYAEEVEAAPDGNHGPIREPANADMDREAAHPLYQRYARQNSKFPQAVRLNTPG
jgi:hypothetical protein